MHGNKGKLLEDPQWYWFDMMEMLLVKVMLNSVISTPGAKFMTIDIVKRDWLSVNLMSSLSSDRKTSLTAYRRMHVPCASC